MITITDRAIVPAACERVWQWFAAIAEHYRAWHPEHVGWRTLAGTPVTAGSVIVFDEWIGRFRLRMRCRIAAAEPGRGFRYEGLFPYSLVRAGGSFRIAPAAGGCEVAAEVHIGWRLPLLGWLLDRAIVAVFPLGDLRRHMLEEGRNLARLLSR